MTEITLVKADGNLLPLNSKEPLRQVKSAVMKEERMGEDTLTLVVEASLPIDFTVGDTLQALGKTYYLNTLPGVQRSARRHLTYTVVLESAKYDLAKTILVNEFAGGKETVNETEFSYTGEFDQLMDLAVINLNRTQGADSWQWRKVDTGADPDFDPQYQECKTLTFSCENVLSALNTICTEWGVEYRIETVDGRRTISVGQIGRQVYEYRFAYGKGRGLYSLTRSNASESSAPTRLYAYGSSQNLGTAYRERRRRLALPLGHPSPLIREGLYVQDDALVERFGLIEGAVIFDQVYPSREGTVSSVDPQDELKFTDLEMFDLNETDEQGDSKYLLGTSSPVVHFNTGNLGGYEFSIAGYNSTTKTFTLVPFTDENEYRYPSADDAAFRIAPGDRYVLLGIALPETYVAQAEERLAEKALEKYTRLAQGRYAYSLEIDPFFMKEYFPNARFAPAFSAGDYLYIEDADLVDGTDATTGQAGTAAVKISSVSIDLYQPYHYTVELSESAAASVITRIVRSEKEIEKIVQINDLADPARARRNLRTTAQLLEMTFDTDGYFRDGRIRPETIETKMIAVGALSQQFLLEGVVFSPNWNADPSQIAFSQGVLTHLGLDREQIRQWTLLPGQVNGLEDQTAYYLYARCEKEGTSGTIVLDTQALRYDQQEGFYYFSIGILSRVEEGFRRICLTYGSSTINGREITTGRIASSDGATYFDLDRGQIGGRIVFSDHSSTEAGETILEGGKLNTRLIDTDRLVARHIEASDGHIADFTIQGKEIVGRDGTIVLQNDLLTSLSALLSGEEDTYSIPIGSGATASAEKTSDGQNRTLTVDTITATTDVPLSDYTTHAGVLRFAVDFQVDTLLPEMGILTGESPTAACEVLQVEASGQETVIDRFSLLAGRNSHLTFINSPASYRIRTSYGATFTVDWLERPEGETQFPILEVSASVAIVGYEGADTLSYQANTPSTRIGTDGLFSFWSPQQYLYFSKDEGFSLRSGITLTSPNGEYSLTINDQGISIKGEAGTDASNNTVSFTMAGTRVNISTGEKLSVAFGKIARWLADLKTVAFTGKYSDLDGRPASLPANGGNADTVDGKHASDFLPTSEKGAKGGVATLDSITGKIPSEQIPLGGTSSTAFPGDRGVTLETKVSNILDGGLKVAKAASADTALEANHATTADTATQATNADYANSATNASYAVHAQEADKATSDSEGNDISSTYLKLSGGMMTGTLVQKKGDGYLHTDVASLKIPANHTGWIALCFGQATRTYLGEIDLLAYTKGAVSVDFTGTVSPSAGAAVWYYGRYGLRGSISSTPPEVVFARKDATGDCYLLLGGDGFAWSAYSFASLSKIVLGGLGATGSDLNITFSALSGAFDDLGMTRMTLSAPKAPSEGIEVERARKATLADTLGEDAYTSSQVVGAKGALSTAEDEFPKDLASIKTPGIYAITSRNTGQPSGYIYGVLCVFTAMKEGNNRTVQMFTSSKSLDGGLVSRSFVRYQFDNLLNWAFTPWVELVDTYDLPSVYVDTVPSNPKDGDILITTTD